MSCLRKAYPHRPVAPQPAALMARSFQAQTIIGHRKHSEAQGKHISSSPPLCRQAWPQRSQERGRGADLRGNCFPGLRAQLRRCRSAGPGWLPADFWSLHARWRNGDVRHSLGGNLLVAGPLLRELTCSPWTTSLPGAVDYRSGIEEGQHIGRVYVLRGVARAATRRRMELYRPDQGTERRTGLSLRGRRQFSEHSRLLWQFQSQTSIGRNEPLCAIIQQWMIFSTPPLWSVGRPGLDYETLDTRFT